jgi:hypothetical protein
LSCLVASDPRAVCRKEQRKKVAIENFLKNRGDAKPAAGAAPAKGKAAAAPAKAAAAAPKDAKAKDAKDAKPKEAKAEKPKAEKK